MRRTPGAEAFGARGPRRSLAPQGQGSPWPCRGRRRRHRAISKRRSQALPGSALPGPGEEESGPAWPARHAAGGVSRRGLRSPQVPAGAPGLAGKGGAALAMLRGPRALAPAAGPTPQRAARSGTPRAVVAGPQRPQLCPAYTYYTQMYPQTVPPAAAPGTCLDATPTDRRVKLCDACQLAGYPVILGTPTPPTPNASTLCFYGCEEGEGGRLGPWSK